MILLLLAAITADPDPLLRARTVLSVPCQGTDCAEPESDRYRVVGEGASIVTAKDRAIRDDGSKCNVVGARRCPKRGRNIFRADLGR